MLRRGSGFGLVSTSFVRSCDVRLCDSCDTLISVTAAIFRGALRIQTRSSHGGQRGGAPTPVCGAGSTSSSRSQPSLSLSLYQRPSRAIT